MVSKSPELLQEYVHEGVLHDVLHKVFHGENILEHVKKHVNIKNPETGHYLELDFWIPSLNIAFEFQDPYHYVTAWATQLSLSVIREKDSSKRDSVLFRGETLMTVPYWWSGSEQSLVASIKFFRPDIQMKETLVNPFSLNPPNGHIIGPGVPGVGELMLASYPMSLNFNTTVAASPWWMGEKYDGMRVCWQPVIQLLFTRSGVRVPLMKSVSRLFGKSSFFDGEIWFGRGCFEESQAFVKLTSLHDVNWPFFRFIVFDSPGTDKRRLPFERRYRYLLKKVSRSQPFIVIDCKYKVAPRMLCRDPVLLEAMSRLIIEDEGEGVILRKPGSKYDSGRSPSLLKLKAVRGDIEALVVADGDDGTCVLQLPDPDLPTFRAAKDIQQPLKRGDIVTIYFENYSRSTLPVNAKVYRVRQDLDWDEVKRSYYSENISQAQNFNTNTTNVFKSVNRAGYWSVKENIRKFLEEYARSLKLDPMDARTWYSMTQAEIANYKGSGSALRYYKGSVVRAAVDLFPELHLDVTRFINMPKHYWKNFEHRRNFFIKYARDRELDPLSPDTWYNVGLVAILDVKGGPGLMQYYGSSPTAALLHVFPDIGLDATKFANMPKLDYWGAKKNRRRFLDDYAKANCFDPLVADNWYSVNLNHVYAHKLGHGFRNYYKRRFKEALIELYPETHFERSRFTNQRKFFWRDVNNRRMIFEGFAAHKQFDPLNPENWYSADRNEFLEWKGGLKLLVLYKHSLEQALLHSFPNIGLSKPPFAKTSRKLGVFVSARRRAIFLNFASSKGFDPFVASNWYQVSQEDIVTLQNTNPSIRRLRKSFISLVKSVLPNVVFDDSQKITRSANYWLDMKNRRGFFEDLARKKGFSPLDVDSWYNITLDDILGEKGGVTVMAYYQENRTAALKHLFPDLVFDETRFANMWKKYYADAGNRRKVLEQFAKSRGFDPLMPDNWYSITSEDILPFQGATSILTFYKGSFISALVHLYPEIGLEVEKFSFLKLSAIKEWERQRRRAFFERFARKRGFDPLVLSNWYSVVDDMKGVPGLAWVTAPYKSQPLLALTNLFPEFDIPNISV